MLAGKGFNYLIRLFGRFHLIRQAIGISSWRLLHCIIPVPVFIYVSIGRKNACNLADAFVPFVALFFTCYCICY